MVEPSGNSLQNQPGFLAHLVCRVALVAFIGFAAFLEPAYAFSSAILTVRVYNYARVSPAVLVSAEREANRILNKSGSPIVWLDCLQPGLSSGDKVLCDSGWSADLPSV